MSQASARGRLEEGFTEIVAVQDNNGSAQITVPCDAAEQLGIEPGEKVLVTGGEGDESLKVKPASALLD